MPVTGLTLPFFSAGGRSLFVIDGRRRAAAQRRPPRRATTVTPWLDRRRARVDEPRTRDVRGRHRRRHGGARAAGAGGRRGARRRRPRPGDDPLRRRRSAASRPGCCPTTPFPHTFLDVVGLQRRARPGANLGVRRRSWCAAPPGAVGCCARLRPAVVVSVGGYASMPAVLAARRLAHPGRRRQLRPPPGPGEPARRPARRGVARWRSRLAAAAGDGHRRAGAPGDPRRRPRRAAGDRARAALGPARRPVRRRRDRRLAGLGRAQRGRRRLRRATHADDRGPRRPPRRRASGSSPTPRRGPRRRDGVLLPLVGYEDRHAAACTPRPTC